MKRQWTLLVFVQFCLIVYLLIVQHARSKRTKPLEALPMKSILIWNSVERIETAYFNVGSAAFVNAKCPVHQCQIFTERYALPFEQYDAVLMNMLEIHEHKLPENEGFARSSHQRFVFLQQESPMTSPLDLSLYDDLFNWTMTYKLNSDILLLYGRVRPRSSAPKNKSEVSKLISKSCYWNKNYSANKTKSLVWMASHCETDSFRETYVKELSKFTDIDIYGDCGFGNLSCPRNEHWISDPVCYEVLAANYKFYLSFENSLCDDYVTEKFFNILAHDLVPVVYGGANYSKLAPPHSFIDAMQFTPRQLARYLNRIANDDCLYNEFFWWKEHYDVDTGIEQMVRNAFCDLCQKLHEDSTVKTYEGMQSFWNDSQCSKVMPWNVHSDTSTNSETKVIGIKFRTD